MIRKFILGDEAKISFNQFSDPNDIADVFIDETYEKFTLDENGEIKVIACWKEYTEKQWAAFFLMSDKISFKNCRQLKKMISEAVDRLKPESVLTYSHDCPMLNRWHKFIGFENDMDGSIIFNDKKLNRWVMQWA